MADLIDRQAAITALERTKEKDPKGDIACFYNTITDNKIAVIEAQPSVDAEQVVRCKDCKWCEAHYDTDGNAPYWICRNWDGGTDADGFCHEAERKTDGRLN